MKLASNMILAVIPILAIHIGLMIYALRIMFRSRKTRLLPLGAWAVIVIIINIFGSLAFLLLGQSYEND